MAVIGNVAVAISASTAGLVSGLSSGSSALKSFGGSITSTIGKLGPLAAAAGAAAGVAGLGAMVSSSTETIGNLSDMANILGVSTVALGGLQHAAGLAGVDTETLNKSMVKMAKGISEASQAGKGTAFDALAELGLSAKALQDLSPDKQLEAITAAMATVNSQTDKVRLSMDLFGKAGAGMVNVMAEGVDGLRQSAEEAKALGLAPSDEDAAKVEAMGDAIDLIKASFVGIANIATITIAPAIGWLSEQVQTFAKWVQSGSEYFSVLGAIGLQVGNALTAYWSQLAGMFGGVFTFLGGAGQETFKAVLNFAFDMFAGIEYGFTHIGDTAAYAWNEIKLFSVVAFEEMSYLFTTKIPAVLTWFADNWRDIFFTVFDYTSTVFINLGKNIRHAMQEIWDFIKSAGRNKMEFAWTPLEEGFVSTVKKLPDIPERAITELEKELASQSDKMGKSFGEGLSAHIEQRRTELLGGTMLEPFKVGAELDIKRPDISTIDAPDLDELAFDETEASKKKGSKGNQDTPVAALQRGSSDAISAIFKALNGNQRRDPNVEATQAQTEVLNRSLKDIAKKVVPVQVVTA